MYLAIVSIHACYFPPVTHNLSLSFCHLAFASQAISNYISMCNKAKIKNYHSSVFMYDLSFLSLILNLLLSSSCLLVFKFYLFVKQSDRGAERASHQLFHSPNTCNCWSWVSLKPKPGTQSESPTWCHLMLCQVDYQGWKCR